MGEDASVQPGSVGDMLLHETTVAWIRRRLTETTPPNSWKETRSQYGTRLREVCKYINDQYDVDNLCREFPDRVADLKNREGDKLRK